jgi:hypothetical protein
LKQSSSDENFDSPGELSPPFTEANIFPVI